jgi:hypothetical protein
LRAMQLPPLNRARDNIHFSGHVSAGMFQMAWRAHQTRSETANWSQSHDSHKIQPPTPYPHLDFLTATIGIKIQNSRVHLISGCSVKPFLPALEQLF